MEANKERKEREKQPQQQKGEERVELPTESSPYVKYEGLEDYKMKGYGTQGHQQPVDLPGRGGGTEAPTLSSADLSEREAHEDVPVRRLGDP